MSLSQLETTLVSVFLLLLMLGMGATLEVASFRAVLRHPRALAIGLASQFGWMPAIALGLALACDLDPAAAVGLVVMGCSSGGTSSNFFAYLADADLALSISMTVVSTIVGVVAIPLALLVYTAPLRGEDAALAIPYATVATTLVAVLVPVAVGVAVRARSERLDQRVERVGTIAGFGVLALVIAGNLWREGGRLFEIAPSVYLAATLLGPVGFGLGWLGARACGLASPQRRAVSLETGIQNAPLALGIVLLGFDERAAHALPRDRGAAVGPRRARVPAQRALVGAGARRPGHGTGSSTRWRWLAERR